MFKRMLESGVDTDKVVYVTVINGYSKNGRAIEAHQLFDIMLENSIQPSSYSYTALIRDAYTLIKCWEMVFSQILCYIPHLSVFS